MFNRNLKPQFAFLLYTFISLSSQGQALTGCYPNSGARGTTVAVTITGTNVNFISATCLSATLFPPAGPTITSDLIYATGTNTVYAEFTIPMNATLGIYGMNCIAPTWDITPSMFTVNNAVPGTTGNVTGNIFRDDNTNCTQDGAEPDLLGYIVRVLPDNVYAISNAMGYYSVPLVPGNYTLSVLTPDYQNQICPVGVHSATINAPGDVVSGKDFGIQADSASDAAVWCSMNVLRPGFTSMHTVTIHNVGNMVATGTLDYVLDPNLVYSSSTPAGTQIGDTIRWSISPPLMPGQYRIYEIVTSVPVSVPLGSPIHCEGFVHLVGADANSNNDMTVCNELVIGSYDPNDKMVWDQDMNVADPKIDPNDSILYYRIRFQNTGTYMAETIIVRDTLDPDIDVSKFELVSSSHQPYTFKITGEGNLEWRFDNINLPDSNSNEPASHGFVVFKVGIKPGFTEGMNITNKAYIYFDFNGPVVTNETSSLNVAVECECFNYDFRVYPNPASQALHIISGCESQHEVSYQLINQYGTVVRKISGTCEGGSTEMEIPVHDLSAGIYYLQAESTEEIIMKKVVIMK